MASVLVRSVAGAARALVGRQLAQRGMQAIRGKKIVPPAAAVARIGPPWSLAMSARRAAPHRRFLAYLVAYRRAYFGQRVSRPSARVRGRHLTMIGGRRKPHFYRLTVGKVDQPASGPDCRRGAVVGRSRWRAFSGTTLSIVFF